MARETIDTTGNESLDITLAKIAANMAAGNPDTLSIGTGTKTATATAGAATLAKLTGTITSEALTTAAAANYTLTITATGIAATDMVFASVANGTNSAGTPVVTTTTPAANSLVIVVKNDHASNAFNGTIKVSYMAVKA